MSATPQPPGAPTHWAPERSKVRLVEASILPGFENSTRARASSEIAGRTEVVNISLLECVIIGFLQVVVGRIGLAEVLAVPIRGVTRRLANRVLLAE